ncbi:CCA tRNA nucleotidyltransferase, mitochondrial [Orbilia ellipsospora]|uniref:CCA tRNA nucleotidyltransferase, mitochondrial n=1 Tax=Orbilia ellipsospora TaxID=2528407 RepID=A0AAV9XR75_9PEZI
MVRPSVLNRRLRLSLKSPISESPRHCTFARRRNISTTLPSISPLSRSISHSLCRNHLLSLILPYTRTTDIAFQRQYFSKNITMASEPPLPTITLTADETKVRNLLVDLAASIDAQNTDSDRPPTVLRITGGWVRDKLLNGKSNDIDIGINNMTGFEFANHLSEFLTSNVEKYGIPPKSIHKIESNPEKSKHLETATTKIMGLDIDFVNLRSETYSDESRIPQMKFGTPTEDALRRDACVNALFYNLMTQQVEDFTTRGLPDLHAKLIRTPLPPYETFRDDPLRVLRLIRFASRLSFTIIPEVTEAMRNPDIKTALKLKISRERVLAEVEKMLNGAEHPYEALDIIEKLELGDCIFDPPEEKREEWGVRISNFRAAIQVLKGFYGGSWQGCDRVKGLVVSERDRYLMWLFAAVSPWNGIVWTKEKKKTWPAAAVAARSGLMLSNVNFESLVRMFGNMEGIRGCLGRADAMTRAEVGGLVRGWGSEWRVQIFASLVMEIVERSSDAEGEGQRKFEPDVEVLEKYEGLVKRIEDLGLEKAWDFKPLLTGTELQDVLKKKPGPWMKKVLEDVMVWQLDHPGGTKDEAKEFVASLEKTS